MSDWPKSGDSITGVGPWKAEALLGSYEGEGFYEYAAAYKVAADALVEDTLSERVVPDAAVYPTLYLYRHYIELLLKGILDIGSKLENTTAPIPEHHKIDVLWQKVKLLLERTFPEGNKSDTAAVEQIIYELTKIDPSGEGTRYGKRKASQGGGKTWQRPIQINLANLREVMNGIANFLDGSYEGIDELLQSQHDINVDLSD